MAGDLGLRRCRGRSPTVSCTPCGSASAPRSRTVPSLNARHRDRRLHRRVGQERHVVLGLDDRAAEANARSTSPPLRTTLPRLRAPSHAASACSWSDVEDGVRAEVPLDLQLLAALHRRPGVVRNHRDAAERLERAGAVRVGSIDGGLCTPAPRAPRCRRTTSGCRRAPAERSIVAIDHAGHAWRPCRRSLCPWCCHRGRPSAGLGRCSGSPSGCFRRDGRRLRAPAAAPRLSASSPKPRAGRWLVHDLVLRAPALGRPARPSAPRRPVRASCARWRRRGGWMS